MPPRQPKKSRSKKKQDEEVELSQLDKEWQDLIDKKQQLMKKTELYIERNKLEILKIVLGNKTPYDTYQTLVQISGRFETPIHPTNICQCVVNPNILFGLKGNSYFRMIGIKESSLFNESIKKAKKNLYNNKKINYYNDYLYYMILAKYLKNTTTTMDEYVKEIIKILLNIGYSIDNLLVGRTIIETNPVDHYPKGMDFKIYLYDPSGNTATKSECKPISMAEAKRLEALEYKHMVGLESSTLTYDIKTRFVCAEEFFRDTLDICHTVGQSQHSETNNSTSISVSDHTPVTVPDQEDPVLTDPIVGTADTSVDDPVA